MSLKESLENLGWHLSQEGIDSILSENGGVEDVDIVSKQALDYDLRDIGEAAFPEEFTKDPTKLEQPIIVQIQKIRNVSAPKANEESQSAPRMLRLTLHDGKSSITGLETSPISSISINTPPGTKILLKNEELHACHGILWLNADVISVLGGKVVHMIEKWELIRSLAKHTREIGADGGPPPWIPFGQQLEALTVDKSFKSIQETAKQDNVEFENQRKGAIAEAQRLSGVKKVFGGGNKPLLDANVQKIVDAGFSEEQAENTLKYTKNNVDKALRVLQKRDDSEHRQKERPPKEDPPKRKGRNNKDFDNDSLVQVKPSGKVSLFDFLEDKLPNVPDRDKKSNLNTYNDEPVEKNNGDRNSGNKNSRRDGRYNNSNRRQDNSQNSRYQDRQDNNTRDDRKFVAKEKPPRFQKKLEERNRQSQYDNVANSSYNNYNQNQYNRNQTENKPYRNNTMDNLVEQTSNLNLMPNVQQRPNEVPEQVYGPTPEQAYMKPSYPNATVQEIPPQFRANNEMPKYQEAYRQSQHNGYVEAPQNAQMYPNMNYMGQGQGAYPARQYGYAGRPQDFNPMRTGGPFLPGSLLGFQNAAVNEQARAMLGAVDIPWKIGDRCLALYWEDNNFYEAEITGISTNTVVVKFCTYGNHEEILKTNCLPFPSPGNPQAYMGRGNAAGLYAARRA